MFNDCIIMAGGSGTRLWPASLSGRPKQFLSQPSDGTSEQPGKRISFFKAALERALAVTGGNVIIMAGRNHIDPIVEECAALDANDRKRLVLIPEPMSKNTAPAIACALIYINLAYSGSERNILVLTSDHVIRPLDVFKTDADAAAAMSLADKLVVFGIPPGRPETGYGYIEAAEALTIPGERYEPKVFSVASFHEKPDLKKAESFVEAKNFYWNSGMFAFTSGFMLAEFNRQAPEVMKPFKELSAPGENCYRVRKGLRILENWDKLESAYADTRAISLDYAIAENCKTAVMVKAGFSWTDVGSWDEYARLTGQSSAEVFGINEKTGSCFVDSDIPVALCGVEDLIVVVRSGRDGGPPAVLISKKGETQRVKEIVNEIKAAGRTGLL